MITTTLQQEVKFHRDRLAERKCNECCAEFEGDGVPITFHLDGNSGRLVFLVCPDCNSSKGLPNVSAMAGFMSRFYMSEPAAETLEAMASGSGERLSEEIAALQSWISSESAPGKRCDECGYVLTVEDPTTVVDIAVPKLGRKLMFTICDRCRRRRPRVPKCVADSERWLKRLVSEKAALFIRPLLEAKRPQRVN